MEVANISLLCVFWSYEVGEAAGDEAELPPTPEKSGKTTPFNFLVKKSALQSLGLFLRS